MSGILAAMNWIRSPRLTLMHWLVLIGVLAAAFYLAPGYKEYAATEKFKKAIETHVYFKDQLRAFEALIGSIGPEKAQDILIQTMPSDARTHMIAHATGRNLYETRGASGIAGCKPYLAGACYHGFMIEMMRDRGLGAAKALVGACVEGLARENWTHCAHAVGHALMVFSGYENLPQALRLCQETFPDSMIDVDLCYNGVFMENSVGNVGNEIPPEDSGRWYKKSDPMYPCNEKAIAEENGHVGCWFMQSQLTLNKGIYPRFEGNITKVGDYCLALRDDMDMRICFNGISLYLAGNSRGNFTRVASECAKLDEAHQSPCRWIAAQASYYFGDHDASSPVLNVCKEESGAQKDSCYNVLKGAILWSYSDNALRVKACDGFPEEAYRSSCRTFFQNPKEVEKMESAVIIDR